MAEIKAQPAPPVIIKDERNIVEKHPILFFFLAMFVMLIIPITIFLVPALKNNLGWITGGILLLLLVSLLIWGLSKILKTEKERHNTEVIIREYRDMIEKRTGGMFKPSESICWVRGIPLDSPTPFVWHGEGFQDIAQFNSQLPRPRFGAVFQADIEELIETVRKDDLEKAAIERGGSIL